MPADRVLAAANGWLGPLPPEGASAIVHRDVDRAGEMAAAQGVRATDLWRAGHRRPGGARAARRRRRADRVLPRLGRVLGEELAGLLGRDDVERHRSRARRWRHLGHLGR